MPYNVTAAPLRGWCSAAPRLWQGRNWFVGLGSIFLQASTQSCSAAAVDLPRVTRNPKVGEYQCFSWLDYSQSKNQGSFFFFFEWAVIHCNFDTSTLCSAVFSPLNDVGDTHFCSALPRCYRLNGLMHNHRRWKYYSGKPPLCFILLPPSAVCLIWMWTQMSQHHFQLRGIKRL